MMQSKEILKSLPLIASVLGKKYGVQVRFHGKTAYTDGKLITLPALSIDCKDDIIQLVRGFIDHESAHIRFTDFQKLQDAHLSKLEHFLFNTIEDYRVEQAISSLFTGCRQNFHWLIRYLFLGKGAGTEPALSVLSWILFTVRSWTVKELQTQTEELRNLFSPLYPGLAEELETVLHQVRVSCPHTEAAILAGKQLAETIRKHAKTEEKKKSKERHQENKDVEKEQEDISQSSLSKLGKYSLSDLLDENLDFPQDAGSASAQILSQNVQPTTKQLQVALKGFKESCLLSTEQKLRIKTVTAGLSAKLQGVLQAKSLVRHQPSRHGSINRNRLHALAAHDCRIFLSHSQGKKLDTAVHILLDCSGSMSSRISKATETCYAIASTLHSIAGINVAVTAFPATDMEDSLQKQNLKDSFVAPLLEHGQKMHDRFSVEAEGLTPLGEALWWTLQTMLPLKEKRKIILIITDGRPSNAENAQKALETAHSLHFEVLGIGIGDMGIHHLLPESSEVLEDMRQLPKVLFRLLQNALTAQN